jgi:hypothetical protein
VNRTAGRLNGYAQKYGGGASLTARGTLEGVLGTEFRGYIIDGFDV